MRLTGNEEACAVWCQNGVGVFRDLSLLFRGGVCYNGSIRRNIQKYRGRLPENFDYKKDDIYARNDT